MVNDGKWIKETKEIEIKSITLNDVKKTNEQNKREELSRSNAYKVDKVNRD